MRTPGLLHRPSSFLLWAGLWLYILVCGGARIATAVELRSWYCPSSYSAAFSRIKLDINVHATSCIPNDAYIVERRSRHAWYDGSNYGAWSAWSAWDPWYLTADGFVLDHDLGGTSYHQWDGYGVKSEIEYQLRYSATGEVLATDRYTTDPNYSTIEGCPLPDVDARTVDVTLDLVANAPSADTRKVTVSVPVGCGTERQIVFDYGNGQAAPKTIPVDWEGEWEFTLDGCDEEIEWAVKQTVPGEGGEPVTITLETGEWASDDYVSISPQCVEPEPEPEPEEPESEPDPEDTPPQPPGPGDPEAPPPPAKPPLPADPANPTPPTKGGPKNENGGGGPGGSYPPVVDPADPIGDPDIQTPELDQLEPDDVVDAVQDAQARIERLRANFLAGGREIISFNPPGVGKLYNKEVFSFFGTPINFDMRPFKGPVLDPMRLILLWVLQLGFVRGCLDAIKRAL